MKTFKQGQKVKFSRQTADGKRQVIGHSQPKNAGVSVTVNGEKVFLEYGGVFQVSENTSAEVANLDNSPLPLLKASWLNQTNLNEQFSIIKPKDDE